MVGISPIVDVHEPHGREPKPLELTRVLTAYLLLFQIRDPRAHSLHNAARPAGSSASRALRRESYAFPRGTNVARGERRGRLEDRSGVIAPAKRGFDWWRRWDSNPRPPACKFSGVRCQRLGVCS